MKLVYFDEAGDLGKAPKSQTPIYVATFLYLKSSDWKDTFHEILEMRREIKKDYNIPVRLELHTRNFILNKNPYVKLNLSNPTRIEIIHRFLSLINKLGQEEKMACINIAIIKNRIAQGTPYNILDQAISLGTQRIDNNIYFNKEKYSHFMLLVDDGYTQAMRKITRKMYRLNYVPYKSSEQSRQIKIQSLIDDPLPKNSKDSYFIQLADLISYVVSQYIYTKMGIIASPKLKKMVTDQEIHGWMEKMKCVFNTKACPKSEFGYGIKAHPEDK